MHPAYMILEKPFSQLHSLIVNQKDQKETPQYRIVCLKLSNELLKLVFFIISLFATNIMIIIIILFI